MDPPKSSPRLIEWTGERCVPWADEIQGIYEHLHRYQFASLLTSGKRILELASGEGFGAAILARTAEHVTAIEIDSAAVAHSRATYSASNIDFIEGSMLDLTDLPDSAFDVVVCFEALEHVQEQHELIDAIDRVLAGDGVLILSTPDRDVYNDAIHEPNPFHVRELDREELLALLLPRFPHVALLGQTGIGGSRLVPIDGAETAKAHEALVVRQHDEWVELADVPPIFLVAVAGRTPISLPLERSYLLDPTADALRERDRRVATRDARIRELKAENRALYAENERLRTQYQTAVPTRLVRRVRAMVRMLTKPLSASSHSRDT